MAEQWKEISEPAPSGNELTAATVALGPVIPPQQQLMLYSPSQWEEFVQEWVYYCLRGSYPKVERFTGAGDRGIDIAGFRDEKRLQGDWDNYQCKHYDKPLTPSNIWVEVGKIVWNSFLKNYVPPQHYYFVAPKGAGTSLTALFGDAKKFKDGLIANWENYVLKQITSTQEVPLEGDLLNYVSQFDFSIFDAKTALELVDDHRSSPVHAARFGGGLKPRPKGGTPPKEIAKEESRYVTQLLEAYADHTKGTIPDPAAIPAGALKNHFLRQREAFYQAESLRVFARDSVPPGTFEALQGDVFNGVIDTHDGIHPDGYIRVMAVTKAARDMQITSNALISCTKSQDRDGICHQLANEDRLKWTCP